MRKDNLDWGKRDPCPPGGQQRPLCYRGCREVCARELVSGRRMQVQMASGQRLGALAKEGEVGPPGPFFIFLGSVSQSLHSCMKSQAIEGRMSSRLT